MKKIVSIILCFMLVFSIAGCSSPSEEANTTGTKLLADFKTAIKSDKDLHSVAEKLSSSDYLSFDCVVEDFTEGYLPGFDSDISGFKKASGFMPMIGTIPFVAYIFEVDEPDSFMKLLDKEKNTAWNICTQADEVVMGSEGNYVFFVMCPDSSESN